MSIPKNPSLPTAEKSECFREVSGVWSFRSVRVEGRRLQPGELAGIFGAEKKGCLEGWTGTPYFGRLRE